MEKKTVHWNNYLATKPLPFGTGKNKINFKTYSPEKVKKQEKLACNFFLIKKLMTLACLLKPQGVRPGLVNN